MKLYIDMHHKVLAVRTISYFLVSMWMMCKMSGHWILIGFFTDLFFTFCSVNNNPM